MIDMELLQKLQPETYQRNDIETSNLFSEVWKDKLVYVAERKSFFTYNGKVWEKDIDDLGTHELAKEFAISIVEYFRQRTDSEEIMRYYAKYLSRDKRIRLICDAKSVSPIRVEVFDRNPYLFNCQNGTVNLVTGEMHEHDPADYLTKISNVWYDPKARSPDFEKFIDSVMQGDQQLIEYLKRALGYSISGGTFQECFFITYGSSTRNGKGTLNSTMMHLLGDYAVTASYETFESKKYKSGGGASEDLARLAGARYVSCNEPPDGMTLNSSLVKSLTGNDRITARYLYENSFEFVANFKLWFNTNHLPAITDDSVFRSGRVHLIPFNRHFSEQEQDKGLKSRLIQKENISGIFNWLLEGFQLVAAEGGLEVPEIIRQEVSKYREISDRIGEFMQDCLTKDADGKHREKLSTIYKVYCRWCKECGYQAFNKRNFKTKLADHIDISVYAKQDHIIGYYLEENVPSEWL